MAGCGNDLQADETTAELLLQKCNRLYSWDELLTASLQESSRTSGVHNNSKCHVSPKLDLPWFRGVVSVPHAQQFVFENIHFTSIFL